MKHEMPLVPKALIFSVTKQNPTYSVEVVPIFKLFELFSVPFGLNEAGDAINPQKLIF